jgi:hypothetical protein
MAFFVAALPVEGALPLCSGAERGLLELMANVYDLYCFCDEFWDGL